MKIIYLFLFVYLLLNNQIIYCKEKYYYNNNKGNHIGICKKNQISRLLKDLPPYISLVNNNNNYNQKIILTQDQIDLHESFMKIAIGVAKEKNKRYASIIVSPDGSVLCSGVDSTNENIILRSELIAITNCSASYSMTSFEDHIIYSTSEPDTLSASAIVWGNFKTVVWGTSIKDLYCKSCIKHIPIDSTFIFSKYYGINEKPIQQINGILKEKTDMLFESECNYEYGIKPYCKCIDSNNKDNKKIYKNKKKQL